MLTFRFTVKWTTDIVHVQNNIILICLYKIVSHFLFGSYAELNFLSTIPSYIDFSFVNKHFQVIFSVLGKLSKFHSRVSTENEIRDHRSKYTSGGWRTNHCSCHSRTSKNFHFSWKYSWDSRTLTHFRLCYNFLQLILI